MKRLREYNPTIPAEYVWHVQSYNTLTLAGWVCGGHEVTHGALVLHHVHEVDINGALEVEDIDRLIFGLHNHTWRINYVGDIDYIRAGTR